MTQNVLVTGFSGFIGKEVCRLFRGRGARVTGIGHGAGSNGAQASDVFGGWIGDITLDTLLAHAGSPDIIVHCASGSSVTASVADPRGDFAKSVPALYDLLAFMRLRCPDARLVFASSAAVYGAPHADPIAEDARLCPASPYGLHKKICEEIMRFHAQAYGLKIAIVRLFSIYGEGLKKQLLWEACAKILAGTPNFSGTGHETRDWVHVSDAAMLMLRAVDHASSQAPVCNGATGTGVAVLDLLQTLASGLDREVHLNFDGLTRPGDPPSLVGLDRRARSWGWAPQMNWQDGVKRYASWYLQSEN